MKIEEQYIKEAYRIIENHNNAIKELNVFQEALVEHKDNILKIQKDIDLLQNSNETNLLKKQQVFEIMSKYEMEISKIENLMNPYIIKIEKLKKESGVLYGILKEKYPTKNDKELQEILFKQLNKYKKEA